MKKTNIMLISFCLMIFSMLSLSVFAANYSIYAGSTYYTYNLPSFSVSIRNGVTVNNYTVTDTFLRTILPTDKKKYNITFFNVEDHDSRTYLNYNFSASGDLKGILTFNVSDDADSCLAQKAVLFSAFALFSVAIIVIAAMKIVNANIDMNTVVMILGLSIVLIIGYLIVSYIASGVCLAI